MLYTNYHLCFSVVVIRYSRTEIASKVSAYRGMMMEGGSAENKLDLPKDELGRVV
jgi:hypothetical protein